MAGVLEGVRVLDFSWGIAGPMTAMLLADHGAQVTKIEPPGGDPFRGQLGYRVWQRGKKKRRARSEEMTPIARAFLGLAAHADVLVESFSPGVTQRLGIDYATLGKANPRLIYCSITAYGRDNSHSARPGLRRPGRRARRAALGTARLAGRRHQSHGRRRGSVRRGRDSV